MEVGNNRGGFEEERGRCWFYLDMVGWSSFLNVRMLRFKGRLGIRKSVWGYLWMRVSFRTSFFKVFLKSELGIFLGSYMISVMGCLLRIVEEIEV